MFGINKEKLQQNELANMLRKREFAEARKLRAEKLANESAEALDTAKEKSKQKSVKPELSEDEKLRNKEERKERAARLMRMMNNMVQLDI